MDKEAIEKAFTPPDVCSICGCDYDDEEGGVQGHFGICPVTFCAWCLSSVVDMVEQMHDFGDRDENE